jgi:3',5'-cyclic AMP phosphodiesterase CpdA
MPAADAITLLHVSDVQFGRNHRFGRLGLPPPDDTFDSLFARLLDDLALLQRDQGLSPDLLVVSGDLAEWGMPQEFRDALHFLEQLTDALGLKRDRVILVPGNHDVNRKACEAYFKDREADGEKPLPPYWPKWRHYHALFQQFYRDQPGISFTKDEPWTWYEVADLRVVVAGLNSTMAESHEDGTHYGHLGETQLRWFKDRLAPFKEKGCLRLGVVHHNYRRGSADDDENLRDADDLQRLLGPYLNLLLHGHTHNARLDRMANGVPILSAGSAALAREARPEEVPNQYQVIRIAPDRLERWTRAFDPAQKRWVGDTRCSDDGATWHAEHPVGLVAVHATFRSAAPKRPPRRTARRPAAKASDPATSWAQAILKTQTLRPGSVSVLDLHHAVELLSQPGGKVRPKSSPRLPTQLAGLAKEVLQEVPARGESNLAELYRFLLQHWVEGESGRPVSSGEKTPLSPDELWAALTHLALVMWIKGRLAVSPAELPTATRRAIDRLTDGRPHPRGRQEGAEALLLRNPQGLFYFRHLSIVEWLVARLAAAHVAQGLPPEPLAERPVSPRMADFFCDLAGRDEASRWARSVVTGDGAPAPTLYENAAIVLTSLREMSAIVSAGNRFLSAGELEPALAAFERVLRQDPLNQEARLGLLTVAQQSLGDAPRRAERVLDLLIRHCPGWLADRVCGPADLLDVRVGESVIVRVDGTALPVTRVAAGANDFGWEVQLAPVEATPGERKAETLRIRASHEPENVVQLQADTPDLPPGLYLVTVRFLAEDKERWRADQTVSNDTFTNPYVAGPPVRDPRRLFGRDRLIENLVEQLENHSVVLLGPRRSGKTSVLYQLAEVCRPDWAVAFLDLHTFSGVDTAELLAGLREEVLRACSGDGGVADVPADLRTLQRRLRDTPAEKLLVLLDELAVLADHPAAALQMRAMSKWQRPSTRIVVAGTARDLDSVTEAAVEIRGSSPLNEFAARELDEISREDARALLEHPVLGHYRYENDALEELLDLGAGWPFFLNMLGHLTLKAVQRQGVRVIDKAHVASARAEAPYELGRWYQDFVHELDDRTRNALPRLCRSRKRPAKALPSPYGEILRSAGLTVGPRDRSRLDPLFVNWLQLQGKV